MTKKIQKVNELSDVSRNNLQVKVRLFFEDNDSNNPIFSVVKNEQQRKRITNQSDLGSDFSFY